MKLTFRKIKIFYRNSTKVGRLSAITNAAKQYKNWERSKKCCSIYINIAIIERIKRSWRKTWRGWVWLHYCLRSYKVIARKLPSFRSYWIEFVREEIRGDYLTFNYCGTLMSHAGKAILNNFDHRSDGKLISAKKSPRFSRSNHEFKLSSTMNKPIPVVMLPFIYPQLV